ncbi:glycosyltransferase family 4 protein [Candidatus Saccharibacteria bacterium]|nr:glycosyltransferase family 4 protein [Candidatus Saccharibacteria bacterium]
MHIVIDNRIRRSSTGRYSDRLVEHLQKIDSGNHYTILLSEGDKWKPSSKNFTALEAPFAQFSFNPLQQIRFARLLYGLKADLVHFPMNQQPVFYFKKVVTSTLDLTMLQFTRAGKTPLPIHWIKMLGYKFLFWYSNKKSAHIITISNYVKLALANRYAFTKDKTTTTYLASELAFKNTSPPKKSHKPDKFVLYVGTAFPHKNLINLVKSFELVAEYNEGLNLVLVGKKEYHYEQLEKLVNKSKFSSRIIITGFVDDPVLAWYYKNAAAYVFPSLSEGFGLPGLEAMAHGCPVVSSNATCLPEVYGEAAHYFDPGDVADMAQKISEVLDDKKLRQKLVEKGHKQVNKYSWENMAKQTLEIYEKALKSNT